MTVQQVIWVEHERIDPNPHQPRAIFDEAELESLADSIRSVGIIHPPVVKVLPGGGRFQLVSGERRLRAAKLAGLKRIPVLIQQESMGVEAALIENIQRVDLGPMELSKALQRLIDDFGMQQAEVAERIGKKRSTVANYLRLQKLPRQMRESLNRGEITMGHAKALLSLEGEEQQLRFEGLLRKRVSVHRMVEKREPLAERFEEWLGAKVAIKRKRKGAVQLVIDLDDEAALQDLLGKLR
jgi:ParB family transcriptional regulator, chromosome partitioning protein